ncbi:MAG TPA: AAA family ATPase [Chthoniobacteraceae bacterium]|jgi:SpoVK/Ycf46/Vps4 family AAA+-type ATPase
MNEQTLKLLEKALLASPDDWETRAHLIDHYLAAGAPERAGELLRAAPAVPSTEDDALRKARVELHLSPSDAQVTLEAILAKNRACAPAYLLLARLFRQRGLREEARKKYGAATVIDESLVDPEFEQWLRSGEPAPELPKLVPLAHEEADPAADDDGESVTTEEAAAAVRALENSVDGAGVTFQDIGGMTDVIERIRMNIIYPFKNPELFQKYKKRPGGGILMFGPPGCGKTHIARATAGECGAAFISVAITDILSKWLGESERQLHEIFEVARRRAPTVIFMDEADALAVNRNQASSLTAPIVNVLLTELDGIAGRNENLMVLAATNAPWRIDNALRRPGRFDRVVFVPPPDLPARRAILEICLRDLPCAPLALDKLARATERFSGADLRAVVERASEKAIYEEMRTGRAGGLNQAMLASVIKETQPSTVEWLETARQYASYANRGGLYDDLVAYFEKTR